MKNLGPNVFSYGYRFAWDLNLYENLRIKEFKNIRT